jgi:RNA polymerase sigma factor for flagellar operon FliA
MADDDFVDEHLPLVRSIAKKLKHQLDLPVEHEELVAWGMQGLVEARTRYDASKGAAFQTFAYYRIRGSMIDGVRRMTTLPRRAVANVRALEAADAVAESVGEARAASPETRADAEATTRALHEALLRITTGFVAAVVGQSEDDAPESPEEQLASAEVRQRVQRALSTLPERERALVQGFYFDGRRFDEVAAELGISKSWASRLHTKALDLLRVALSDLA